MLITIILIAVVVLFELFVLGIEGYLLWTMHKRIESLANTLNSFGSSLKEHSELVSNVIKKVSEGETVILDNFSTLDKRLLRVEHEIKDTKQREAKNQEVLRTITRIQRQSPEIKSV